MYNKFIISECKIILNDKSVIENELETNQEKIKKTLIIDITNNKEDIKYKSENDLKKIIEKYIKKNEFIGTKTINYTELLPYQYSNFLIYIIIFILDKIIDDKSFIKKLENSKVIGKLLVSFGAVILYLFYNLGYDFLYGYYFGGDYLDNISLFQMYVNPVPFNFKSIVGIGLGLLISVILIAFPLWKFSKSNSTEEKIINIIIFIGVVSLLFISSAFLFIGKILLTDMIYFLFIIVITPVTITIMLFFVSYANKYHFIFMSGFMYAILSQVFILKIISRVTKKYIPNIINVQNEYIQLFVFYGVYIGSILLTRVINRILICMENNKIIKEGILKIIIKNYILLFPVVMIIASLLKIYYKVAFISIKFLIFFLISSVLTIIIIAVVYEILIKKKSKSLKYSENNVTKDLRKNKIDYKYFAIDQLVKVNKFL